MITKETSKTNYLKQALAKLGRNVKVSISDDSAINFQLPSSHKSVDVFPAQIMQKIFAQLIVRANGFITKEMSLTLENANKPHIVKQESFVSKPITSWLIISGAFKGLFVFSYEGRLAEYVLNRFISEPIEDDEYNELLQDMISEITNIISGGASDLIHDSMGNSILEVPVTIVDQQFKCECNAGEFLTYQGITNRGFFEITTVVSNA